MIFFVKIQMPCARKYVGTNKQKIFCSKFRLKSLDQAAQTK